jgi:DNA polymerase epsilon subunit 1
MGVAVYQLCLVPHTHLQKNHLSGLKRKLLKLSFWNVQQLMEVRREVAPAVARNKERARTTQAYADMAMLQPAGGGGGGGSGAGANTAGKVHWL